MAASHSDWRWPRALATDPEILFLDEPTASLDPASVLAIEEIVTAVRREGVRVVLVTHDIGQARRMADDVVFLSRGRVDRTIRHALGLRVTAPLPASHLGVPRVTGLTPRRHRSGDEIGLPR